MSTAASRSRQNSGARSRDDSGADSKFPPPERGEMGERRGCGGGPSSSRPPRLTPTRRAAHVALPLSGGGKDMKPGVILSMEPALSLTSATLRFVHLGWRVIKLEATPQSEGALPGDPNRYIGSLVADEGRRSYFIGPNVGKESIALNLKSREGRDVLHRLIRELNVDVFCCNTLPSRYNELGIDYDSLRAVKPDLIWAAISAMGPDYPDAAGYDPAIQAQVGYMEVTGMFDGPPTLAGIPLVDLKAGDEVYANVWKALAERATSG